MNLNHSPTTVILRNPIAMSKYNLSIMQQKVFLETALYFKNNPEHESFVFVVREFLEKVKVSTGDLNGFYLQVRDMMTMIIYIPNPKKRGYGEAPIFSYVGNFIDKYNRACVKVNVDKELKPYFIEIANGDFFTFKIENTRILKSAQSIKLYLYLRSWARLGKHTIDVAELKDILNVDQSAYRLFTDFKLRVLDKAKKEIETKTDLRFTYSLLRVGNTNTPVTRIVFTIEGYKAKPLQVDLFDETYKLYHGLEPTTIDDYSLFLARLKVTSERLHDVLLLAQEEIRKGIKIKSLQAYLINLLKTQGGKGLYEKKKEGIHRIRIDREIKSILRRGIDAFKRSVFIEIGKHAHQELKTAYFSKINGQIANNPMLKDTFYQGDVARVEIFQECLGAELNTKTDEELLALYFESLGKPVVKENGFWRYVNKS